MCASNHFYLYSNAQFACHMKENALEKVMPHQSILKDVASKKIDFQNWKPQGEFKPGDYYTTEIEEVREQFYATRRIPKAILKGLHNVKRLIYNSCVADDFQGTITVHSVPEEWSVLLQWCEKLRDMGVDVSYEGEGLPSLTKKVWLAIMKRK